jgi:hypothetical protein
MPARPLETALRLAAAITIMVLIAARFGDVIAATLLPIIRSEIEVLVPEVRIEAIAIGKAGADSVIRLEAGPAAVVMVAGKLLPLAPQTRFWISTPTGHVFQTWILLIAVLTAWPATSSGTRLARLALGVPVLSLLFLIDVPMVLASELNQTLRELAAESSLAPLDTWKQFLEGGGRLALPIVTAAITISFDRSSSKLPTPASGERR